MRRARLAGVALGLLACVAGPAAGQGIEAGTTSVPGARAQDALAPDTLDGVVYRGVEGVRTRVFFAPSDSLRASAMLNFLEAQPRLPGVPDTLPSRVTAILAHTPAAFDALTGGTVPEWRAGVAIPALGRLIIPSGEGRGLLDPAGRRVLRHEWAHLGLHQALGDLRVPRWFDEGYAQWAAGGWDATEVWRLRLLFALGRAPDLDSLSLSWPRDRASAEAAYLLAASAVTYLLGESDERGLELFLERWRSDRSFETALRRTFGVTSGQFEEDWRRHVKDRYGWLFVLSHSAVFWMVMALVLLFMARVRQTRDRERLARLRATEAPDSPAFWEPGFQGDGSVEGGPETPSDGVEGAP